MFALAGGLWAWRGSPVAYGVGRRARGWVAGPGKLSRSMRGNTTALMACFEPVCCLLRPPLPRGTLQTGFALPSPFSQVASMRAYIPGARGEPSVRLTLGAASTPCSLLQHCCPRPSRTREKPGQQAGKAWLSKGSPSFLLTTATPIHAGPRIC